MACRSPLRSLGGNHSGPARKTTNRLNSVGRSSRTKRPQTEASLDAPLLALAPELEAAATPYLAYDRDQHVTAADPDYDAAHARYDELHGAVTAVAERIFALRPTTLPGLLMVAHAAAVTAEQPWEEAPEHVDHDGRRLRLVCDGLFRLVGVDWRGRPLLGGPLAGLPAPAAPNPDAEMLDLGRAFDAAFAAYLAFRPEELAAEAGRDAAWEADPELTMEAMRTDARLRARYLALAAPFDRVIGSSAGWKRRG